MSDQQSSPLLDLPPELRNHIYLEVIASFGGSINLRLLGGANAPVSEKRAKKKQRKAHFENDEIPEPKLALHMTCRQIYNEAHGLVYSSVRSLIEPLSACHVESGELGVLLKRLAGSVSKKNLRLDECIEFRDGDDLDYLCTLDYDLPLAAKGRDSAVVGRLLSGVMRIDIVDDAYDDVVESGLQPGAPWVSWHLDTWERRRLLEAMPLLREVRTIGSRGEQCCVVRRKRFMSVCLGGKCEGWRIVVSARAQCLRHILVLGCMLQYQGVSFRLGLRQHLP